MNRVLKRCFLLGALCGVFCAAGCAEFGTYMRDRGHDFADCFTVRAGLAYGFGVRAQVTNYFGASAGFSLDIKKYGFFGRERVKVEGGWGGIPILNAVLLSMYLSPGKHGPPPLSPFLVPFFTDFRFYEDGPLLCSLKVFGFDLGKNGFPARKTVPPPFLRERFFIEVGATLGAVGLDLGFNPVEFLDFLLGWFTADITDDDEKIKRKQPWHVLPPRRKPSERRPTP